MQNVLSSPVPTPAAQRQIGLHNLAAQLIQEASWLSSQKKVSATSSAEAEIFDRLIKNKGVQYRDVVEMIFEQPDGQLVY